MGFWGSWRALSVALQRCIKELGAFEPWRLHKLALMYSYGKCYVLRAFAERKKTVAFGLLGTNDVALKSAPAHQEGESLEQR